jgi:DNA gyrase/topoisomerase IV subunit A
VRSRPKTRKPGADAALTVERIAELGAAEQFILTVTETGFGKRSSAYEYRRTGRGGQGLTAHGLGGRAGTRLAAAFPVEDTDELLLVTSGGQMIRTPVDRSASSAAPARASPSSAPRTARRSSRSNVCRTAAAAMRMM